MLGGPQCGIIFGKEDIIRVFAERLPPTLSLNPVKKV
jgi:seryl-tRNA(Sec) selenium transferase